MQIKVNQVESTENEFKIFIDSFKTGQELAKSIWGDN